MFETHGGSADVIDELLPEVGADYIALDTVDHWIQHRRNSSPASSRVIDVDQGQYVRVLEVCLKTQEVRITRGAPKDAILIPLSKFKNNFGKLLPAPIPDTNGRYSAKKNISLSWHNSDEMIPKGAQVVITEIDRHGVVHFRGMEKATALGALPHRFWELVATEKRSGKPMSVERGLELLHPEQEAELRSTDKTDKARLAVKMAAHQAVVEALNEEKLAH